MMPDMDGFETFERIKKLPMNASTPVVFLTADVDVENEIKGDFECGQVVPGKELIIRAGDGFVRIDEIQPEGKKRMGDADFLRGNKPEKFE